MLYLFISLISILRVDCEKHSQHFGAFIESLKKAFETLTTMVNTRRSVIDEVLPPTGVEGGEPSRQPP